MLEPVFRWTGVGSRKVPDNITELQFDLGRRIALIGGQLSTGDAIGSDENFLDGYRSANPPWPANIYYTALANQRNLEHQPLKGWHEAECYETYEEARDMAYKARGGFYGLNPKGIALHTRNAMQVLSEDLRTPSLLLVCYARPVGKQGKVDGGTNTAVQIARQHHIPVYNLYLPEDHAALEQWIAKLPIILHP